MSERKLPHDMFDVPWRRKFTNKERVSLFLDRHGTCVVCHTKILPERGDKWIIEHLIPLADWTGPGDPNGPDNIGPAHEACARTKTSREANGRAKLRRQGMKHLGVKKERRGGGFQTNRDGKYKAKIGGGVVRRDEE